MGMITSVRAPLPVAEVPRPPEPVAAVDRTAQPAASAAPVAPVQDAAAVQQPTPRPAATEATLMAARLETEVRATEAAEAARQAYIEASIAAGINPLPLP